jgi:hypothetical protein
VFGQIHDDEDITREKGFQDVLQPARVPNGALQSRNETSEAQPTEIELRPVLLVREHSRDEPTLSWRQFQIIRQRFAPPRTASSLTKDRIILWESYRTLGEAALHPSQNNSILGEATLTHDETISLWVKRRFVHDEIFRRKLAEPRAGQQPHRETQPTMLYQIRQVVLSAFG